MTGHRVRRLGLLAGLVGLLILGATRWGITRELLFTRPSATPTPRAAAAYSPTTLPARVAAVSTNTPPPVTPVPTAPPARAPAPPRLTSAAAPTLPPVDSPPAAVASAEPATPWPAPPTHITPVGPSAGLTESPAPPSPPASADLPDSVLLPLPKHAYQKLNNCGPTTTMMVMSMFGLETTQAVVADVMRPNKGDKNVDATEILAYLERAGLQSRIMVGGETPRLRRLVAAGIPVIVEQLLNPQEDIAHFRLVRGYNAGQLITGDSYYGASYTLSDTEFEQLWRMFNHRYLPVWRVDQTATVRAILGDEWDGPTMYTRARDQALAAVQARPADAAWWLALGHSQYGLGNWDSAIRAYLQSVALGGLTKRVLWYQWWPVTALNRAGRYEEAIRWADGAIASAKVYAEMRYERAVALLALGRGAAARAELQHAVADDPNYGPTRQLLAQLVP